MNLIIVHSISLTSQTFDWLVGHFGRTPRNFQIKVILIPSLGVPCDFASGSEPGKLESEGQGHRPRKRGSWDYWQNHRKNGENINMCSTILILPISQSMNQPPSQIPMVKKTQSSNSGDGRPAQFSSSKLQHQLGHSTQIWGSLPLLMCHFIRAYIIIITYN